MLDRKIYCVWVGHNNQDMNENRKAGLASLFVNSKVNVVVIDNNNLFSFILPEAPLHEGFQYLSDVHKADYIRTYMMHFYGGGYTDIKPCNYSWTPYFDQLEQSKSFGIGAQEDEGPLSTPEIIREEYGHLWPYMISNDMYIFKPRSEFTYLWYTQMILKMNIYLEQLRLNPAQTAREAADTVVTKYPIRWAGILAEIFHPLCVKYTDRIIKTMPYPIRENYR